MIAILTVLLFIFAETTNIVSPDGIKSIVNRYILAHLDTSLRKDAVIEFRSLPEPIRITTASYILLVGSENVLQFRGNVSLPVEIFIEGKVQRRLMVSVRIKLYGTVLVAKKQLERHAKVIDADCEFQTAELTSLSDDIITKSGQLTGKRTTRIISAGSVVRASALETAPAILQDEAVTLIVKTKRMILSTIAVAKEDGLLGSIIKVQKLDSHERIEAKVIGEHTVEVSME